MTIAELALELQTLREVRSRAGHVPLPDGNCSEIVERGCELLRVAQPPESLDSVFEVRARAREVANPLGEGSGRPQRPRLAGPAQRRLPDGARSRARAAPRPSIRAGRRIAGVVRRDPVQLPARAREPMRVSPGCCRARRRPAGAADCSGPVIRASASCASSRRYAMCRARKRSASPLASSCSAAYSRMTLSIEKRRSPPGTSAKRRTFASMSGARCPARRRRPPRQPRSCIPPRRPQGAEKRAARVLQKGVAPPDRRAKGAMSLGRVRSAHR